MLSREVKALISFVEATGLAHRVTSTTNHSKLTTSGNPSRHRMAGTDGEGLAVDFAGPSPGGVKAMLAIYRAFLPHVAVIHELIFWAPDVDVLVRRKLKVVPMTYGQAVLDAHRTHVHVSVDKGTFLVPAPPTPVRRDPVSNHPPKAIVARPQGDGYWVVAHDGGVFAFGAAPPLTAIGGDPVERIISASAWPDGEGLLCLGEDGGVFALGSAVFAGRVDYRDA